MDSLKVKSPLDRLGAAGHVLAVDQDVASLKTLQLVGHRADVPAWHEFCAGVECVETTLDEGTKIFFKERIYELNFRLNSHCDDFPAASETRRGC